MRKHGPFLAALACLAIALAFTLARSLAEQGVWGIDGRTFASCSSSPLWTLLLAAVFKIAGVHTALPFLLAALFAAGIVAAAHL